MWLLGQAAYIHFTSCKWFIHFLTWKITFSIKDNTGHVPSYSEQSIIMIFDGIICFILFQDGHIEMRKIPVPSHRYTPLKTNWMKIFTPVVEHLKLQIRFNLRTRHVELRVS